jgi:hypothetical protein
MLKTQPKQLLGSLPLNIALPALAYPKKHLDFVLLPICHFGAKKIYKNCTQFLEEIEQITKLTVGLTIRLGRLTRKIESGTKSREELVKNILFLMVITNGKKTAIYQCLLVPVASSVTEENSPNFRKK